MPNRGQENLQNLRMKGRVSKDRFLVSGLGRQGLSSFQFAFPEENKSKIQTMFTKCACKPATFVYHYLWFHTAPSLEKSLPKGRTASTAIHLPATLWAAAGSWCGHTPLHSWLCTEEEKKKASWSFLLTSSFPMMVGSQQHILSLSIKWHLDRAIAVMCKSTQAWMLYSIMLATDTLTSPGLKVATTTDHQHQIGLCNLWKFVLFPKGLACIMNHYLHP